MSTMNFSLPKHLRASLITQVTDSDYTSSSEYVRELLRKERDRVRLRCLLNEGLTSPLMEDPMDASYFDNLRRLVEEQK